MPKQWQATVGEGGVLGTCGRLVGLDSQAEDSGWYLGPQPVLADAELRRSCVTGRGSHVPVAPASSSSRQTFGPPGVVCGISPRSALACHSLCSRVSSMYRLEPPDPRRMPLPKYRRNSPVKTSAKNNPNPMASQDADVAASATTPQEMM